MDPRESVQHPAVTKRIGGHTYQPADIRDDVAPFHALEEDTRDVCEVCGNTSVRLQDLKGGGDVLPDIEKKNKLRLRPSHRVFLHPPH
jgi:hypothetical protein